MGLTIVLEGERGQSYGVVGDPNDLLGLLLPDPADESFVCLRFIEQYQNTVFNQGQMRPLIPELERIRVKAPTAEARAIVDAVIDLARKCAAEPHLYLKFYGD